MGLLDSFGSPDMQLALGLLDAGSAKPVRTSFGAGLLGAVQGAQAYKQAQEDRAQKAAMQQLQMKLINAQIGDVGAQEEQRRAQAKKLAEGQALLARVLGGEASPNQYGTPGGGISLGGVSEKMVPRPAGLAGASPEDIAALKANGVDISGIWETAKFGKEMQPGYRRNVDGTVSYFGDPTKGIDFDPATKQVRLLPGAADSQATLTGAVKEAEESVKAKFDPIQVYNPDTGRKEYKPRAIVAGPNVVPRDVQAGRDSERLVILNDELAREKDPAVRAALQREIARVRPAQGGIAAEPGLTDTWSYDKDRGLMVNGRGQTRPLTNEEGARIGSPKEADEAGRNNKFLTVAKQAKSLLMQSPTESGLGSMVDDAASFFGVTPRGAKEAAQLRSIGGWLTSNVPRMEGPQSDGDRKEYQSMAALVGDSTKPVQIRMAALNRVTELINQYAAQNPGQSAKPTPDDQPTQKTVVRTGRDASGRRVVQYSDGSIGYGN